MPYIADLHIHSPYARATSKYLSLETIYQWAMIKGIDVVGTGDFTHPVWLATLKEKLQPAGNGFYQLKAPPITSALPNIRPTQKPIYFCLSTEISTIYSYKGKVRKSHHLVYAPDFATVDQLNARLSKIGNLAADGRPILGLSARDLLAIVHTTSPNCHFIPAHIWTPWFSIFGSKSGYDDIQETFRDMTPHIFALETGLSSDPAMNWRVSALDQYTMVSNSDAHSPQKLGREATRFDTVLSYEAIFKAMRTREGFAGTLEHFPEEGKYHIDGHRACNVALYPQETRRHQSICPVCKKPLTVGVLHRVEALADRDKPDLTNKPPVDYIVPLPEIIAEIVGQNVNTKRVNAMFTSIINQFGNEFTFLHHTPLADIAQRLPAPYAIAIEALRTGNVKKEPGYDGIYGTMRLLSTPKQAKDTPLFSQLIP